MFAQHSYIEECHKIALESAIRRHEGITEVSLAKMYRQCADLATLGAKAPVQPGLLTSIIRNDHYTVVSATDENTGLYMQLAGAVDATVGRQLTLGQKWIMQGKHDTLSTTALKLW